jgi:hypothetical protein
MQCKFTNINSYPQFTGKMISAEDRPAEPVALVQYIVTSPVEIFQFGKCLLTSSLAKPK